MLSTGAVFFYFYNRIKVFSGKENYKKKKKKRLIGLVLAAFEFCLNNGNISSLKDSTIVISNTF